MSPGHYPPQHPHAAPGAFPPDALTCPWCKAPASPAPAAQACSSCRRRFTLSAGPALDGALALPNHPGAPKIMVRWSAVVTYQFATLDAGGVTSGTLDPVVAMAPLSQSGIAYPDIVSIAVWRSIGWLDIIAAVLLPLPFALFCAFLAIALATAPRGGGGMGAIVAAAFAVVFGLATWFLLRRGAIIGRRQIRIVGRASSFTIPFKTSPAFHGELLRRCGLPALPVP